MALSNQDSNANQIFTIEIVVASGVGGAADTIKERAAAVGCTAKRKAKNATAAALLKTKEAAATAAMVLSNTSNALRYKECIETTIGSGRYVYERPNLSEGGEKNPFDCSNPANCEEAFTSEQKAIAEKYAKVMSELRAAYRASVEANQKEYESCMERAARAAPASTGSEYS